LGRLTWSGVDLFFVLSGFLIGGILLDAKNSDHFFKAFYLRRIYRILPLYLAFLATIFIVNWTVTLPVELASFSVKSGMSPVYYLTLSQNLWMGINNDFGADVLAVTWSLSIEEQFYLILPLIVRFTNRKALKWFILGAILVSICSRIILFQNFPQYNLTTYVLLICRVDALMLGVAGALLVRSERGGAVLLRFRWVLVFALVVLGGGILLATFRYWTIGTFPMVSIGYTWLALFYLCLLLLGISKRDTWIGKVLSLRPLVWIGGLAYGLYLLHQPVLRLCYWLFLSERPRISSPIELAIMLLAAFLALLLSVASWKFFERPFVEKGHRFKYDSETQVQRLDAAA